MISPEHVRNKRCLNDSAVYYTVHEQFAAQSVFYQHWLITNDNLLPVGCFLSHQCNIVKMASCIEGCGQLLFQGPISKHDHFRLINYLPSCKSAGERICPTFEWIVNTCVLYGFHFNNCKIID